MQDGGHICPSRHTLATSSPRQAWGRGDERSAGAWPARPLAAHQCQHSQKEQDLLGVSRLSSGCPLSCGTPRGGVGSLGAQQAQEGPEL